MNNGLDMKFSAVDVGNVAVQIQKSNSKIREIFEKANAIMNRIDETEVWTSSTQAELIVKYNKFKEKFPKINDELDSYVSFLNDTVARYSGAEAKINDNIAFGVFNVR